MSKNILVIAKLDSLRINRLMRVSLGRRLRLNLQEGIVDRTVLHSFTHSSELNRSSGRSFVMFKINRLRKSTFEIFCWYL